MKRFSKAELKKAILAVEAERLKHPIAFRPSPAQERRLQRNRDASERMVSEFLKGAGFDLEKFQALQDQRATELERMVAKDKEAALRRASRQKDTLHSSILKQSEAWRDVASRDDFFPYPTFSLETPFLIWTTPLLAIDSAAAPFGSWAKFRVTTSQRRGSQKVGFYFYWPSPYRDYAVINAATFMSATGHLRAHAPWTFGVNTSEVYASALFGLWFGFPNATTSGSYVNELLGATGAYGSTTTGGDVNTSSISAGVSLNTAMFAVPPRSVVVFEVALVIDYDNDDGNIDADFQSGDFSISCPVVVFSLLNSPPPLTTQ
jgi:hypothetical protein